MSARGASRGWRWVHLMIDVNGYYVDHHHDDCCPTRTELAARVINCTVP